MVNSWAGGVGMRGTEVDWGVQEGVYVSKSSARYEGASLCHVQKFADDTAIVGCTRSRQEEEYRNLIKDFVTWCSSNHLLLNSTKTREMVVD